MSDLNPMQAASGSKITYPPLFGDQFGHPGEANQYDDDSSNSSTSRRLQCLVCGAHARGYNFGVTACESCKAFFRRNALRQEIRPCGHGGDCVIREDNRKACPACRINKCFEVGMKKELIHPPERLLMRAKPKSWHNSRRYMKMPNEVPHLPIAGRNEGISPPTGNTENMSLQKQMYYTPNCDFHPSLHIPNDSLAGAPSKKESQSSSRGSLLVHIIDKNGAPNNDGPSGSGESNASSKVTDAGITCCPMTDLDDTYYYLSSKFHYILGMAKEPFSYDPNENYVQLSTQPDTIEDGFAMYEYIIKRMVSTLVQMPHFHDIDRTLFIDIVKEKLFGAAQIFSCLYFNLSLESWVMLMTMTDGISKEVKLECSTFFYNAFRYLTKPCAMSSIAILKMGDVDAICKANMNCFKRICALSKNNGVFMIALIGFYLSIDEGFTQSPRQKEMNSILQIYEHFLMQMSTVLSGKFDVCEFYRDILGIMQIVKWIEARYVDLGKYMEKDRLPPLLKEIMSNETDEKRKHNTS